ncbi:MAG: hypothetical protein POH28_05505, partial [Acidocella sp.]|nr:hypothetical protein [Acidocella sp.]
MMVFLMKLLGPLAPYLGAALAVAGLCLYVTMLRHEAISAVQKSQALMQINEADAASIAAEQQRVAALDASLTVMDRQITAGSV